MTGYLSTHILDTANGLPASGVEIVLYRLDGEARQIVAKAITNADGRTDQPLLDQKAFATGVYELVFAVGPYLRATQSNLPEPLFLDEVPIRFGISDAEAHYHVPLLLSAHGMTTYRGS